MSTGTAERPAAAKGIFSGLERSAFEAAAAAALVLDATPISTASIST